MNIATKFGLREIVTTHQRRRGDQIIPDLIGEVVGVHVSTLSEGVTYSVRVTGGQILPFGEDELIGGSGFRPRDGEIPGRRSMTPELIAELERRLSQGANPQLARDILDAPKDTNAELYRLGELFGNVQAEEMRLRDQLHRLQPSGPSCDSCQSEHCCSVRGDAVPPMCVTDPDGSLQLWMPWTNEEVRKLVRAAGLEADRLQSLLDKLQARYDGRWGDLPDWFSSPKEIRRYSWWKGEEVVEGFGLFPVGAARDSVPFQAFCDLRDPLGLLQSSPAPVVGGVPEPPEESELYEMLGDDECPSREICERYIQRGTGRVHARSMRREPGCQAFDREGEGED